MVPVDYAKLHRQQRQHHVRFARRVKAGKLTCQECGGGGSWVEDVFEGGIGPDVECGRWI